MKKGIVRDILTVIFFVSMFIGPILFGVAGFIFTGWSIATFGFDGMKEAFNHKEYFDILKYALPFLVIKFLTFTAGFVGLILGWIPGYMGLCYLERNDPPPDLEEIYIPKKRRNKYV